MLLLLIYYMNSKIINTMLGECEKTTLWAPGGVHVFKNVINSCTIILLGESCQSQVFH